MGAVKIFQKGALQLESSSWNDPTPALSGQVATPYLTLGKQKTTNFEVDNSIDTQAFKDVPRKVTEFAEENITCYSRFSGNNPMLFWAWGFETTNKVIVLTLEDDPSISPDAVYEYSANPDGEEFVFLREEEIPKGKVWIFSSEEDLSEMVLSKVSGDGPATVTVTEKSDLMCEHIYELDRTDRHVTDFKTDEQIEGWEAGDKKNRLATIAVSIKDDEDLRFEKATCKSFGFSSEAANFAELSFTFLSKNQTKGDFGVSATEFRPELRDSDNIVVHHQLQVDVGVDEDSLVALGVTSAELSVDIPLPTDQDTRSGLNIMEPVLEGKYDITFSLNLSRYSADTYQIYRDAWTSVVARVSSFLDYYRTDFFIHKAKISDAGPDDSDVTQEPLEFQVGIFGEQSWSKALKGNNLVQKSPVTMRVRDYNFTNNMFL